MSVEVCLTLSETRLAAEVGISRRLRAIHRGREFPGGWDDARKNGKWENDIQSAAAECAFAKFVDAYWSDTPEPDYDGDVGEWQVRAVTDPSRNLLVYQGDPDEKPVALVLGEAPVFTMVGWIKAADAKLDEFASGERLARPGFIVPQARLLPFNPPTKASSE